MRANEASFLLFSHARKEQTKQKLTPQKKNIFLALFFFFSWPKKKSWHRKRRPKSQEVFIIYIIFVFLLFCELWRYIFYVWRIWLSVFWTRFYNFSFIVFKILKNNHSFILLSLIHICKLIFVNESINVSL